MIKCEDCGKEKPKHAIGLCLACYHRQRYRGSKEVRLKAKKATYNWMANNRDRWLEICNKAVKKYYQNNKEKIYESRVNKNSSAKKLV